MPGRGSSIAGQLTHQYIASIISELDWRSRSTAQRAKAIDKMKGQARRDARSALMQMGGN